MITLLVSPSCTSCRKAKAWLEDYGLAFEERNIGHNPLTKEELKIILSMTDEGTEEIISQRSQAYHNLQIDLEDLSMSELLELFIEEPSLVRRPILMDDLRLQIGYNKDEMRMFVPRKVRDAEFAVLHKKMLDIESA